MEKVYVRAEELSVTGDDLLHTLKGLILDGDVRRIIFRDEEGRSLIEIPSTLGLQGPPLSAVLAAVGALAALEEAVRVVVEKIAEVDEEMV